MLYLAVQAIWFPGTNIEKPVKGNEDKISVEALLSELFMHPFWKLVYPKRVRNYHGLQSSR